MQIAYETAYRCNMCSDTMAAGKPFRHALHPDVEGYVLLHQGFRDAKHHVAGHETGSVIGDADDPSASGCPDLPERSAIDHRSVPRICHHSG